MASVTRRRFVRPRQRDFAGHFDGRGTARQSSKPSASNAEGGNKMDKDEIVAKIARGEITPNDGLRLLQTASVGRSKRSFAIERDQPVPVPYESIKRLIALTTPNADDGAAARILGTLNRMRFASADEMKQHVYFLVMGVS